MENSSGAWSGTRIAAVYVAVRALDGCAVTEFGEVFGSWRGSVDGRRSDARRSPCNFCALSLEVRIVVLAHGCF